MLEETNNTYCMDIVKRANNLRQRKIVKTHEECYLTTIWLTTYGTTIIYKENVDICSKTKAIER